MHGGEHKAGQPVPYGAAWELTQSKLPLKAMAQKEFVTPGIRLKE